METSRDATFRLSSTMVTVAQPFKFHKIRSHLRLSKAFYSINTELLAKFWTAQMKVDQVLNGLVLKN